MLSVTVAFVFDGLVDDRAVPVGALVSEDVVDNRLKADISSSVSSELLSADEFRCRAFKICCWSPGKRKFRSSRLIYYSCCV